MGHARVGVSVPCALEHQLAVINGGSDFIPLANPFSLAPCKYLIAYHERAHFDAALLANPGFPSSRLLNEAVLVEYLENCRWVIVDESYLELSLGGESAISLTKRYRNLIVVRDASATFAIPGEPIAYLVAHPDTLARIVPFTDPNSIGMSSEVLASVFPQMMSYLEQTSDYLEREIPWLQCMLSLIPGIHIYPAEGNFVLCRFEGEGRDLGVPDAKELSIRLQLTGLLVPQLQRVVGLEDRESYFCIAAQRRQHDQKLIETMKRIITG
jgi:threonine-phosphate decarboxylase